MEPFLSIDFGTSTTKIFICKDKKIEGFRFMDGNYSCPSAICFDEIELSEHLHFNDWTLV